MGIESMTKEEIVLTIVNDGVRASIESIARDLERTTGNIQRDLPDLKPAEIPEYQKAVDAIRAYADALYKKAETISEKESDEKTN